MERRKEKHETLQLKRRLFITAELCCQRQPPSHLRLPAPPECLFKPTHCSANWITFYVKIGLLKQQCRWLKQLQPQKYKGAWLRREN